MSGHEARLGKGALMPKQKLNCDSRKLAIRATGRRDLAGFLVQVHKALQMEPAA
jgi:hypothetical protein